MEATPQNTPVALLSSPLIAAAIPHPSPQLRAAPLIPTNPAAPLGSFEVSAHAHENPDGAASEDSLQEDEDEEGIDADNGLFGNLFFAEPEHSNGGIGRAAQLPSVPSIGSEETDEYLVDCVSGESDDEVSDGVGKQKIYGDLRLEVQSLESLIDGCYWEACCPWLSCSRLERACSHDRQQGRGNEQISPSTANADCAVAPRGSQEIEWRGDEDRMRRSLVERGYFQVLPALMRKSEAAEGRAPTCPSACATAQVQSEAGSGGKLGADCCTDVVDPALCERLARGVARLMELGHSPTSIIHFDEAWQLAAAISPLVARVGGNQMNGDWYAFCVSAQRAGGFTGPHRDKPMAGEESFRADGLPMYTTVWVALTAATPERSCLYFVPAGGDPSYRTPGDCLSEALPSLASWVNIVAQPVPPGGVVCFSHRLVHWGSRAAPDELPRIALSFALSDPAFETPSFDHERWGSNPPLVLRAALCSAQAVLYHTQEPTTKAQYLVNMRLFRAGRSYLHAEYAERVEMAAQFIKFRALFRPDPTHAVPG
eukprot:TRINITY_DN4813_c0_g1_i1.p1 TRINITY_DN4813_c0_g1~~TRINITY_DN4813_c0_g1_i1.p1  ORF type:complete len:541 (-),score=66.95 TRINITY_DN4813_c0_g1_i1:110-1732(-)